MKTFRGIKQYHNKNIDELFHQLNVDNIGHVIYWYEFFNMVKKINGDIVECGVGRGRSLLITASLNNLLSKREGGQRNIFAYDSFQGFPEPSEEDISFRKPRKGEWAKSPSGKYKYSPAFIEKVLNSSGEGLTENLTLVEGFYEETLNSYNGEGIALLHVDCDLYKSYLSVLNNLYDRVLSGGLIIFDDIWEGMKGNEKFPGARKAVSDFFGREVETMEKTRFGTYYLVKK